ncbi:MAG: DNA polymerase I [Candidatus Omnitrophota bacterium]|nr:DNA polymerase I [Candidatus Omnitrophota bacterium]
MKTPKSEMTKVARPKLFLIDGMSFCYRAYFAIKSLSNSQGEPTNAIYGFITMMRKLVADHDPDYFAICFDRKEPTFRHEMYEDYKAHRKPMPDDLADQIEPIKEFCRAHRYALYEMAGFEADDVMGTLAAKGAKEGFDVYLVTGDKDAMQLVNDRVKILNPNKNDVIFDADAVRKRYGGLGPDQVIDIMTLMGDTSDNIPGVRGIGEKTAVKLIQQFGSVENLYRNLDKIKSKSQRTLLADHKEDAERSKELVTIDTDVKVDFEWGKMTIDPPDEEKLTDLLKRYEFRGMLKEVVSSGAEEEKGRAYTTITTQKELEAFARELAKVPAYSFDTETTDSDPMRAHLVGLSFSWKPLHATYIPVSSTHHGAEGINVDEVLEKLRVNLESSEHKKYGQNIKYDWIVLRRHGVELNGIAFDTMIASYLINPLKLNHNLDDISLEYLNIKKIPTASLIGTGKKQITMAEVPLEIISTYACEDADCVFRLVPLLSKRLEQNALSELFRNVEMPLAMVLAKMEINGVCLDLKFLKKLSDDALGELERLTREIWSEAGDEFNINSTKQLAEILFVKMQLPIIKRTKTGYSTDVSVLEKLAADYELPRKVLDYRENAKLRSTYLEALPAMLNPETKRIHTSFHQTTTATGRLSSSDPNLQNIPIKTETGRLVRKAFVPRSFGKKAGQLLAADYSQVELRILAHFSGDKNLTKAFNEDRDVHRFTATLLYGIPEEEVTREMRNVAKTINFSIIYGKTAYGLSQDLKISISEADGFIENYFNRYAQVRDFLEAQKEKAREQGYLTTLLGRRAYFPEINVRNMQIRQFAERAAINAPIQGTAADLVKLAMIAIQDRLEKEALESLMTIQVHDELVFDVPPAEREKLEMLVREEMQGVYELKVPLKVDVFCGESWYKN